MRLANRRTKCGRPVTAAGAPAPEPVPPGRTTSVPSPSQSFTEKYAGTQYGQPVPLQPEPPQPAQPAPQRRGGTIRPRVVLTVVGLVLLAGLALYFFAPGNINIGGSGAAPAASVSPLTGPNLTTDVFSHAQITVHADTGGVSDGFTVNTGGKYDVSYNIDDGTHSGCAFTLILTDSADDGPSIQMESGVVPSATGVAGDVTWSINPGSYVLQKDETGAMNCRSSLSATVTAQQ